MSNRFTVILATLLLSTARVSASIIFSDDFNDSVVDTGRYQQIGSPTSISESGGLMTVGLDNSGFLMDLDSDIEEPPDTPICVDFDGTYSGFDLNESYMVEHIYDGLTRFALTVTQTSSFSVKLEAFDAGGGSLGSTTVNSVLDYNDSFGHQTDTFGGVWSSSLQIGGASVYSNESLGTWTAPSGDFDGLKFTLTGTATVAFDNIGVSVPEPSGLAVCVLLTTSMFLIRRRRLTTQRRLND